VLYSNPKSINHKKKQKTLHLEQVKKKKIIKHKNALPWASVGKCCTATQTL